MEQLSLNITGFIAVIVFSSLQITIPEEARAYIIIRNAASTKVII
jgi:hypothetical protein